MSSDLLAASVSSSAPQPRSHLEYEASLSEDGRRRGSIPASQQSNPGSRWYNQVKDWLAVSEPSAQALKQQKRNTYKKHGLDLKDPQAAAKMHLPVGKLPAGVITSTRGPDPEQVLLKATKEKQTRPSYSGSSVASQSKSSSIYSTPSSKGPNPVAPWED